METLTKASEAPTEAQKHANGASEDGKAPSSSIKDASKDAKPEAAQPHHHHHHLAPPPPPFSPFLLPFRSVKILTLIRHAQGYHNAAGEREREAYKSERYRDAHLTRRGWQQAAAAGRHWHGVYAGRREGCSSFLLPRPELVVVSPLNRTLETASAIFGEEGKKEGEEGGEEGGGDGEGNGDNGKNRRKRLLMRHRPAVPGRVAPAPAFFTDLPFVAHELCREESGLHPCDGRHPTSQKRAAFPGVDFSLISNELDPLYDSAPDGQREPKESVKARALEFARWLLRRPESHVAVVSHAGFLHFLGQAVGAPQLGSGHHNPQQQQQQQQQQHGEGLTTQLTKWFDNAEARVFLLADAGGGGGNDDDDDDDDKGEGKEKEKGAAAAAAARGGDPLAFVGGGFSEDEEEDEEKR